MNNSKIIEDIINQYINAVFTKNYDGMLSLMDTEGLKTYRSTMIEWAKKMDYFGETQDFLGKMEVKDLKKLESLPLKKFYYKLFGLTTQEIGAKELKKILKELEITDIEEEDPLCTVTYTFL